MGLAVLECKVRSQPISRVLFPPSSLRTTASDDHSSRPAIARGLERPTRWLRTGRPRTPPYLALLRAGFCLPPTLPPARCALTAPFHPYPSTRRLRASLRAVFFLCHWSVRLPCPGITRRTALWSSDFPLPPALRGEPRFPKAAIVWPAATIEYRIYELTN